MECLMPQPLWKPLPGSRLTTFAYDDLPPSSPCHSGPRPQPLLHRESPGRQETLPRHCQPAHHEPKARPPSPLCSIFLSQIYFRSVFSCTQIPFLFHSRNGSNMKQQEYFGPVCLLEDSLKVFCWQLLILLLEQRCSSFSRTVSSVIRTELHLLNIKLHFLIRHPESSSIFAITNSDLQKKLLTHNHDVGPIYFETKPFGRLISPLHLFPRLS